MLFSRPRAGRGVLCYFFMVVCQVSFGGGFIWAAEAITVSQSSDVGITLGQWHASAKDKHGATIEHDLNNLSHTGAAAVQINVPKTSSVDFYEYYQDIKGVTPGELYEISAWIKTKDVAGGVGAYMGLGAISPQPPYERTVTGEAERISGTSDWTKVTGVLLIPEKINTLRLIILVHGTGKAWFDDFQLRKIETFQGVQAGDKVAIEVTNEVTTSQFIGFGYEDDSFFHTDENFRHGITQEDIELRENRISELAPSVIATIFWWDAISPTRNLNEITYDAELFKALVRTLQVHQNTGRKVFFGGVHWGWAKEHFAYNEKNVEKGAKIYADTIN